jgi:hypothetical protein
MSALPALPMMQLLLRQGRLPAALSLGLLLVALLLLGLVPAPAPVSQVLWLASVLGGLVQGYYAWRLRLDAGLLQLLQDQGLGGEAAARWLDEQLQASWPEAGSGGRGNVVAGNCAGPACAGCCCASTWPVHCSWPRCCWRWAGR